MDNFSDNHGHGQSLDRAFLLEKLHASNTVFLESSRKDDLNTNNLLFSDPITILVADTLDEIPALFDKIEEHLSQKKFVAGYFAYECGYHFENIVTRFASETSQPLIWLGVYELPTRIPKELLDSIDFPTAVIINPKLTIEQKIYAQKILQLKNYIQNGDTYQVNFTDRIEIETDVSAVDFYFFLRKRQHVPYSALIRTEFGDTLSFSPELFFRRKKNSIITKPMKGTCKRGRTISEDAELSAWLHRDEKNRSENLMIVDLLRNDIGKICTSGSVQVSDMFAVEKYETLLQMTSIVSGTLKERTSYYEIFKALFPCGSVTGAPKIRTMQIINELEQHQRGVYCGAIGYFSPDYEAVFNVGIRTITFHSSNFSFPHKREFILENSDIHRSDVAGRKGVMGVGSGIVFDSIAEQEFEECLLKANFLLYSQPEFQLLETILWNGSFSFLDEHLMRMKSSAEYFSMPFDKVQIIELLKTEQVKFQTNKRYRVRVLSSDRGIPTVDSTEFNPVFPSSIIKIAEVKINSNDQFYFHKTTNRPLYNKYVEKISSERIADYIFLNERHEITEGTFTNIFIKKNNTFYTPPVSSGILNGIYRIHLLAKTKNAKEQTLFMDDILTADEIHICNSVRGMQKVTLSEM